MKKIGNLIFHIFILLLLFPPMSASADMGSKPSVVVEFVGLEEEEYYVTDDNTEVLYFKDAVAIS